MSDLYKKIIWSQFGAAIDTLENAIRACPDDLWGDGNRKPEFWYIAYHTIFFLDYYLSRQNEDFRPPEPFTLSELDPSGVMPDRVYSKDELLGYLKHGRQKARATIENMTDEWTALKYKFVNVSLSHGELLLYIMRHLQHHAAQLNLILRRETDSAPGWVFTAKEPMGL
ncbi:MAG: DinB family protein [candidate division Zixibacteria bacterium]|nr:DinB family protein [candidate division Zixibacteria bacterium]NIR62461.1 DinB family protein [candidate division Zixibacteria bacterium]NIS15161.1 DinB family protein [candidate division Zixibacteria bacterium]NIS44603.1 DinB family protein [candidate division Zixibacteria bacterium]NIT51658.1 DinB family protein [candidate division Zixibacteria bacterium]